MHVFKQLKKMTRLRKHYLDFRGNDCEARPEHSPRARSLRRALLMPQANPGSLYRCGQRT